MCSQVILNLHAVIFHFSCCLSFIYFHRVKVAKRPARGRNSHSLLLLVNCLVDNITRPSLVRSPFQSYLPSAGCCGTRSVRLYDEIYTRTALKQPRTMACIRQRFTQCCLRCRFFFEITIVVPHCKGNSPPTVESYA